MAATYTFSGGTGNYASAAAQTKYSNSNITECGVKIRVKGSAWTNLGTYNSVSLLQMVNRDGFRIYASQADAGVYRGHIYTASGDGSCYHNLGITPDAGTWYVIYVNKGSTGGFTFALGDASGTLITESTSFGGNALVGTTGEIEIGPTAHGSTITIDGAAIYNTNLSGSARFATPTTGDSGIVGLYKFDEGSGTSVADATGGTSLTITGGGSWNTSDGSWDAGGGGGSLGFRSYYAQG